MYTCFPVCKLKFFQFEAHSLNVPPQTCFEIPSCLPAPSRFFYGELVITWAEPAQEPVSCRLSQNVGRGEISRSMMYEK
jgi:hypothetical protein